MWELMSMSVMGRGQVWELGQMSLCLTRVRLLRQTVLVEGAGVTWIYMRLVRVGVAWICLSLVRALVGRAECVGCSGMSGDVPAP